MANIIVPDYKVVVPNSIYVQPAIVGKSGENKPHARVLRFSRFIMPSRERILDYVRREIIDNDKFGQPDGNKSAQMFSDDIKSGDPHGEEFIFRSHPMKDYSGDRTYLSLVDMVISVDEMAKVQLLLSDRRELSASDMMFQESYRFTGLDLRLDTAHDSDRLILPNSALVNALFDSRVRRSAVLNVRLDHDDYDDVRELLSRVNSVVDKRFERIADVSDDLLYSIASYLWNTSLGRIKGSPEFGLVSDLGSGFGLLGFVISSPSDSSSKPSDSSVSPRPIIPPDPSLN